MKQEEKEQTAFTKKISKADKRDEVTEYLKSVKLWVDQLLK
jgi:hypothetical protein